jgi:hypothetical protein
VAKQAKNRRVGRGGVAPPEHAQFKPGQSGNPKGRPQGTSLTAIIKRVLAEQDGNGTKADKLIEVAMRAARTGDFRVFKELIDRNDGKIADQIQADGKLRVEVVYVDANNPTDAE